MSIKARQDVQEKIQTSSRSEEKIGDTQAHKTRKGNGTFKEETPQHRAKVNDNQEKQKQK